MAKSKEEMQDIALHHMEKISRKLETRKIPTLKEQYDEMERVKALSPEQRLKELSWSEWRMELDKFLRDRLSKKQFAPTEKCMAWVHARHKKELEDFHQKGTAFSQMIPWLQIKQEEHINIY